MKTQQNMSPINPLVDKFPELDSGMHISTSNVMEQDFKITVLAKSAATSLDLEVSKIAKTIVEHNRNHKKQVLFSPVHWVTDYLRTEKEADLHTGFDLANGDSKIAKEKKKLILERIYHIVTAHLSCANLVAEKRSIY
jgi:ABC-type Na+ transport system ATPase subunit NatA